MDISCKRIWGYHPSLVSFADTNKGLAIVNRSGNVHSAEDAARYLDKSIDMCMKAGFRRIRMRGDCKFSQTEHLDRWNEQGVKFNFGYENRANLKALAEDLPESAWKPLKRSQRTIKTTERIIPVNMTRQVIRKRGYVHLELEHEDVAEFEYKPAACHRGYMLMISLAWTLKAWSPLLLPISPRHRSKHKVERTRLLTMEFRTFLDQMIHVPCRMIRHARKVVYRLLNSTDLTPAFFRLCDSLPI